MRKRDADEPMATKAKATKTIAARPTSSLHRNCDMVAKLAIRFRDVGVLRISNARVSMCAATYPLTGNLAILMKRPPPDDRSLGALSVGSIDLDFPLDIGVFGISTSRSDGLYTHRQDVLGHLVRLGIAEPADFRMLIEGREEVEFWRITMGSGTLSEALNEFVKWSKIKGRPTKLLHALVKRAAEADDSNRIDIAREVIEYLEKQSNRPEYLISVLIDCMQRGA